MKKVKMLSDHCRKWEVTPSGNFVTIPGLHRNDGTAHKIHYGNMGAYIWWKHSTYYIRLY